MSAAGHSQVDERFRYNSIIHVFLLHDGTSDITIEPQSVLEGATSFITQKEDNNMSQIQRDKLHPMFLQFGFGHFRLPVLELELEAVRLSRSYLHLSRRCEASFLQFIPV